MIRRRLEFIYFAILVNLKFSRFPITTNTCGDGTSIKVSDWALVNIAVGIYDLDPAIMSCKLAPLQRMDLRAIKIWNKDLVRTRAEMLELNPNITNCYGLHVLLGQ